MNRRAQLDYLRLCYIRAASSPDPSNQNAAVVVTDYRQSVAVNCPVAGRVCDDRDTKLVWYEHAERGAIYEAARHGMQTSGAAMFCPWAACVECARAIVLSGITDVYVHRERTELTPERWLQSVKLGAEILRAGKVNVHEVSARFDCPPILVNGAMWNP